jgi:hypothetical protein
MLGNAIGAMNDVGIVPQLNNGLRPPGMQQQINSGANPLAAPGRSLHELGRAVDLDAVTPQMVQIMKDAGFEWGGDWPAGSTDKPHFYQDPFPGDPNARRDPIKRLQDWLKRCGGK